MSTFLLNLSFFSNDNIQKDNKKLDSIIQGDITCTTSGGGFLFLADTNRYIYKLDHHINAQTITTSLQQICYLQASQTSQEILAAGNSGMTYALVITNISEFSENTPNFSFYQASSFELPLRTKPTMPARLFCSSPSLTYIAFVTGSNELLVYKAPHSAKSKPIFYDFKDSAGITNLFITDKGLLYITTLDTIVSYDVNTKTETVLDNEGAHSKFAFMFNNDSFAVCRNKTITFYQNNTKETLDITEGNEGPENVGGVGPYFYATYPCNIQSSIQRIKVVDPNYKVLASQQNLKVRAAFVHIQWGALVIIQQDKNVLMYPEISDQDKIERFCSKSKFEQALNMAHKLNLSEAIIANIHKVQGDHFYSLSSYDQAIDQYIQTLGFTEPSYVIQKFVEPHHAENLMKYLIALQEKKLATKQHTTLLFNCYTKIRANDKLQNAVQHFIDNAKSKDDPSFDVETAVDVLKRNGYQKNAEDLAKAYNKHSLYIQLLYENQKYKEILSYMQTLPGSLVKSLLTDYGSEIMDNYPEGSTELTKFCVKCCTAGIPDKRKGAVKIQPDELAMIFMNNDLKHFDFLYQIFQADPDNLSQDIWNVLIEMALRANSPKIMELLNYPNAGYSNEQALVYLTAFNHSEGKKLIYEKMGLYTLILQEAGPEDCLEICKKYGNEDRTLWSDALVKLSTSQCEPHILESFLEEVQNQDALPFLTILKVLKNAGNHSFKTILPIVQATFKKEQDLLHNAEKRIEECNKNAAANKEVVQTLSTKNFVINQSKCASCGLEIDSESLHFMCGHSFHTTCLGDGDAFCPLCKNRFERILEQKINRMTAARDQSSVKQKLDEAGNGFQFLLQQVGASLFASGVDLMSSRQDDEKINEAKELLRKMSP